MRAGALLFALFALAPQSRADDLVVAGDGGEPGPAAAVKAEVAVRCLRPGARCEGRAPAHKAVGLFGLRASEAKVLGHDAKATLALASLSTSYVTSRDGGVSARAGHFALLGGGRGGMEYGLGLDLGFGLYHPLGDGHGPFSRIGGRGFVHRSPVLYASLVELPQLQLGYQLLRRSLHLELAARGGPVLAGRVSPEDERRRLGGSFEWGGHAALRGGPLDLELEFSHVEPREGERDGGVDVLSALFCGGARYLGACFDARVFRGATERADSRATSVLFGVTLGGYSGEHRGGG